MLVIATYHIMLLFWYLYNFPLNVFLNPHTVTFCVSIALFGQYFTTGMLNLKTLLTKS